MQPLRILIEDGNGVSTLRVVGALEPGNVSMLRGALLSVILSTDNKVNVDLRSVHASCDGVVLDVLVQARRELTREARRFAVVCADAALRQRLQDRGVNLSPTLSVVN
jgi:hypothetical protein